MKRVLKTELGTPLVQGGELEHPDGLKKGIWCLWEKREMFRKRDGSWRETKKKKE